MAWCSSGDVVEGECEWWMHGTMAIDLLL